jgi:FtsP/CotA-like multicopper oxidase with cupredoxin domain
MPWSSTALMFEVPFPGSSPNAYDVVWIFTNGGWMFETPPPAFALAAVSGNGRCGYTRSREGHENINGNVTQLTLERGRARFRLLGVSAWSPITIAPALRFPSKLEMLS